MRKHNKLACFVKYGTISIMWTFVLLSIVTCDYFAFKPGFWAYWMVNETGTWPQIAVIAGIIFQAIALFAGIFWAYAWAEENC